MAFCQWGCNWVCQPPPQLRGVGIYSHGCKQGCFQPPGRVELPGLTFRTRRSYGRAGDTTALCWECRQEPGSLPVVPQWPAGDGAIAFYPADWFGNLYKTAPGLGVDVVVGL